MKSKLFLLTKVNLSAVLSPARIPALRSGGSKAKKIGYAFLFGFLGVYFAGIVGVMTYALYGGLKDVGLTLLIPGLFLVAASFLIFFTSLFTSHGYLFQAKDLDMLFSFPVTHGEILASKFIMLYLYNLLFSAVLFGVSGAVYCVLSSAGIIGWLTLAAGVFFIPLLPLGLGVLISYFMGLALRKVKRKNAVTTILAVAFTVLFIALLSNTQGMNDLIIRYGGDLYKAFKAYYPPAGLIFGAFDGGFFSLLIFIAINVLPILILLPIVARHFASIVASYGSVFAKADYTFKQQKQTKKLAACFKKEIKRVFASSTYLLNSGVGIVMLVMLSFTLLRLDGAADGRENILPFIAVMVLAFCSTFNATTSCAISLEAKTFWIYKSAPVDVMTIFEAKARANEVLYLPFIFIFGIVNAVVLKLNFQFTIFMLLIPIVALICASYYGLLINLAFPKLKWESETQVIKQSMSVLVFMFSTMGFNILIGVLSALAGTFLPVSVFEILLCVFIVYLLLMVFLEYLLRTWGVAKFQKLF